MKNNYIKSVMNHKNEFRIDAYFKLFGTLIKVDDLKIDTGCGKSVFPFKRLGVFSDEEAGRYKYEDVLNNTPYILSYVVETGGHRHSRPQTIEEKLECTAMGFCKEIKEFTVCGMELGNIEIRINYDRKGNLLLGMDILKTWDIHIGKIKSGETILLACPYNQINDEYLLELERTFKLGTIVSSANVRNEI